MMGEDGKKRQSHGEQVKKKKGNEKLWFYADFASQE